MNHLTLALEYFFVDLVGGVLHWPIWWYSRGLAFVVKKSFDWVKGYARSISLSVWIKNLFVPMFGMYDWQSRIISFFMRVFQIIARTIALCIASILICLFLIVYVVSLPVVALCFIYYLTGSLWI